MKYWDLHTSYFYVHSDTYWSDWKACSPKHGADIQWEKQSVPWIVQSQSKLTQSQVRWKHREIKGEDFWTSPLHFEAQLPLPRWRGMSHQKPSAFKLSLKFEQFAEGHPGHRSRDRSCIQHLEVLGQNLTSSCSTTVPIHTSSSWRALGEHAQAMYLFYLFSIFFCLWRR